MKRKVGPMDLTSPPRVFLQIDTNGDNNDRSEAVPESAWMDLTWHYERIGGQEVEYIRADLATLPAGDAVRNAEVEMKAARYDWLRDNFFFSAQGTVFRHGLFYPDISTRDHLLASSVIGLAHADVADIRPHVDATIDRALAANREKGE